MRRKGLLLALGFVCAAGLLASWLSSASPPPEAPEIKLLTREVSLGKGHDPSLIIGSVSVSSDSRRVAYTALRASKHFFVVDGVEGGEYDGIADFLVPFSPDSKRVAYPAKRGGKWVMVVDGVEGKRHHEIVEYTLKFSPDSKRLAYVAKRRDKWLVVVDGVEGEKYDGTHELVFSPDSRRVGYTAVRHGMTCPPKTGPVGM